MPTITAKQEAFCQSIASGASQAEAYRSAYDSGKMKPESIHVNASKLMADTKVAQRVAELKAELSSKALWTREMSVKGLVAAFKVAKDKDNSAAMTGAIKELNVMHGYNEPAKLDLTSNGDSLKATVIQIVGMDGDHKN